MTYGIFELSGQMIATMAIIVVAVAVASLLPHAMGWTIVGITMQLGSFVLLLIIVTTWFTQLDWNSWGPFPVIFALIFAVMVAAPALVNDDIS